MKFTIISAVYNVEKYIDHYFKSLIQQTLDFETSIQLILIDDGSTDNVSSIIKKWQTKYPNNILYIYQENQGQASARNNGLTYVKTPWVTFIDPDDFLHKNYFKYIDDFLNLQENISMLTCKLVYYFEHLRLKIDYHPLKGNFTNKEEILTSSDLAEKIILSASASFFKMALIQNKHLKFSLNVKPNFEDGHFIAKYLLESSNIQVAFLSQCKYYYRKRKSASSTIDNSWTNPLKYDDLLHHGYLDLLKSYTKKKGYSPINIQRTILYDLMWHFRKHLNSNEIENILTGAQLIKYRTLLFEIFTYIDSKTILEFNLAGCTFMYKLALLTSYKKNTPRYQVVYIDSATHKKINLHYFSPYPLPCDCMIDESIVPCREVATKEYIFLNQKFIVRYDMEIDIQKKYKNIDIKLGNLPVYIGEKLKLLSKENIKKDTLEIFKKYLKNIIRKIVIG